MTLTLEVGPDLEAGLRVTAAQAGVAPDHFVLGLLRERVGSRPAPKGVGPEEARLLEQIGEGLPVATWARYRALKSQRDAGDLTDAEHDELIRLVNEVEIWNAQRLEAVMELARLRGVPFPDLVAELGLGAPATTWVSQV